MNTTQRRLMVKIKQLRAERGARLENGRHDPSLGTLVKLAKALKVPVGELVE